MMWYTNKPKYYCAVCEREDHNARTLKNGTLECPAQVLRILPEPGSLVPGSDVATR